MPLGDSVTLALGIDATGATRGAREFEDAIGRTQRASRGASDSVGNLGKSVDRLPSAFAPASAAISGFVGGLTAMAATQAIDFLSSLAGQIITTGDAYQRLDSRLAMVTGSMQAGSKAHADLYDMSQRLGVSFESTGGFFTRIASQSKELGLSYEDLVRVTETLEGAFKLGGASAAETSSAMMQLGQSFSAGKLQGDEFRSVAENAPVVLDMLSQSLGVTRGELMEMAQSGELTSQALAQGLLQIAPQVAQQVQSLGSTVSDETARMWNAWSELLAEFAKTSGASEAAKDAIRAVTALLESDEGKGAVVGFANAITGLVAVLNNLAAVGAPVADALNTVLGAVQSAGDAIAKYTSYVGQARNALTQAGGFVTGGGFGGEFPKEGQSGFDFKAPAMWSQDKATGFDAAGGMSLADFKLQEAVSSSKVPAPVARPRAPGYRMQELPTPAKGRSAGASRKPQEKSAEQLAREEESITDRILQANMRAHDQQIALIEMRRDAELQALDKVKMAAEKKAALAVKVEDTAAAQIAEIREKDAADEEKKREASIQALSRYEEANLSAHGKVIELIQRQRDEELRAIDANKDMSIEQKAQARVLAEDSASQQIIEIRRREAEQIRSLEEENLQTRAGFAFGDERKQLQKRLLEMQRDAQLADIQASQMSEDMKAQASALKADTFAQRIAVVDPTPWQAASRYMQEFGENLTSVEGMTQGVIQGIASIGNTAASAFADAIMSGESFSDTLDALGKSLTRMLLQMTMQMAMQQAIGAAVGGIGAMMAPGAGGTPYSPAEGGGVFGGTAATMAKGGTLGSGTGLRQGVYTAPTYFSMRESGFRAYARGTGLMAEAGPEAVLPLSRSSTGQLGVSHPGGESGGNVNITINNNSSANVSSESKKDASGNKDIILTIADQVESIVSSRMSRSGTRVNRAVGSVGSVVAR